MFHTARHRRIHLYTRHSKVRGFVLRSRRRNVGPALAASFAELLLVRVRRAINRDQRGAELWGLARERVTTERQK